jgi:hypothetical protein
MAQELAAELQRKGERTMSANFEAGLTAYAQTKQGLVQDERDLVLHVLSMPTTGFLGLRRKRILARMERKARNELGYGATEKIDWSTVDWASIFGVLIQFLMLLFAGV